MAFQIITFFASAIGTYSILMTIYLMCKMVKEVKEMFNDTDLSLV